MLGIDRVSIKNVDTNEGPQVLQPLDLEYSQVSALCWVPSLDEGIQTLTYGNAMGWIVIVQRRYHKAGIWTKFY